MEVSICLSVFNSPDLSSEEIRIIQLLNLFPDRTASGIQLNVISKLSNPKIKLALKGLVEKSVIQVLEGKMKYYRLQSQHLWNIRYFDLKNKDDYFFNYRNRKEIKIEKIRKELLELCI